MKKVQHIVARVGTKFGRNMMASRPIWFAAMCLAITLCGCNEKIDPSFVAERWSTTLSAFNIDAVFPPRYVQVGDVYLTLEPASGGYEDKDRFRRRTIRLGRVNVRNALKKDMQASLQFASTTSDKPSFDIFGIPKTFSSLTRTAYPGFNIAEFSEADLGVAWPIQAFRAVLGLSGRHQLVASISIPNAEDAELPAFDAYRALTQFCAPRSSPAVVCDASRYDLQLFMESIREPNDPAAMVPKIVIVTHVYYAREIDYAYTTGGGAGLSLAVAVAAAAAVKPGTPEDQGSRQTTQGQTTAGSAGSAAQQEAEAVRGGLKDSTSKLSGAGPGGNLEVVYASSSGTLLKQTFPQPVAIGFRGLWIYPDGVLKPVTARNGL